MILNDSLFEDTQININGKRLNNAYTLMNKDIPLIDIDEDKDIFDIYYDNYAFLPFGLKAFDNLKYVDFVNWAMRRVLVLNRDNAKKLLNICGLSQTDNFEIAKACRLLSIDDCYWLRLDVNETWDNVDLRKNSLSKSLAQIALDGVYITISGDVTTPEFTNQGSYPKSWERTDNSLRLLKKSKEYHESEREVLSSKILDILNIEHIHYEMIEPVEKQICACDCMTNDKYSRLNFGEFDLYCRKKGMSALKYVDEHYPKDFANMLVVDYILANTDRHPGNWGFFVDNNTNMIVKLHPLYDHNSSFDETFNDNYGSIVIPGKSMLDAAKMAKDQAHIDLSPLLEIGRKEFDECEADHNAFIDRVKKLI